MGVRLIRDGIFSGKKPPQGITVRSVADRAEHVDLLRQKIVEEAGEAAFAERNAELVEELGDVLEAVMALAWVNGISMQEVEAARLRKATARGSFLGGTVMEIKI